MLSAKQPARAVEGAEKMKGICALRELTVWPPPVLCAGDFDLGFRTFLEAHPRWRQLERRLEGRRPAWGPWVGTESVGCRVPELCVWIPVVRGTVWNVGQVALPVEASVPYV